MRAILALLPVLPCAALAQSPPIGSGLSAIPPNLPVASGTSTIIGPSLVTIIGPCDIMAQAGTPCVAAHSVTRRMFGGYSGALFQLTRASDSTTQDIGSTGNGIYNASTVATFCAATACYFSKLYDQTGNANHLPQSTVANMAPWMLHYANALPVVWNSANNAYYRNRLSTTNIPTGAAASSEYYVRATDMYSADGDYGRMETNVASPVNGEMHALSYNNWSSNTISGTLGFGIDLEGSIPAAAVVSAPTVAFFLSKFNAMSGTFTNAVWSATSGLFYPQLTQIPTVSPPLIQAGLSLGEGGDGTLGNSEFFEGAIITGTTTSATDALVAANVVAFYNRSPVFTGPGDVPNTGCSGALCVAPQTVGIATSKRNPSPLINGQWGLRKLNQYYTGYAAQLLRASDSTTRNIGFTATGDFDDAAAQAFCSGTTCTVQTLYNQGITHENNDTNQSVYNMVQSNSSLQPKLAFNVLNGKTVLQGTGTQYICTSTSIGGAGPTWTMAGIADRTGGTGAAGYILSANGAQGDIGYSNSANTAAFVPGSTGTTVTATVNDNTWNFITGTILANGNGALSVNNGSATINATSAFAYVATNNCLFSDSYYSGGTWHSSGVMTGYIAEAYISAPGLTSSQQTAIYNNAHAYYGGVF